MHLLPPTTLVIFVEVVHGRCPTITGRQLRDTQVHAEQRADHEQRSFMTTRVFRGELLSGIDHRLPLWLAEPPHGRLALAFLCELAFLPDERHGFNRQYSLARHVFSDFLCFIVSATCSMSVSGR